MDLQNHLWKLSPDSHDFVVKPVLCKSAFKGHSGNFFKDLTNLRFKSSFWYISQKNDFLGELGFELFSLSMTLLNCLKLGLGAKIRFLDPMSLLAERLLLQPSLNCFLTNVCYEIAKKLSKTPKCRNVVETHSLGLISADATVKSRL